MTLASTSDRVIATRNLHKLDEKSPESISLLQDAALTERTINAAMSNSFGFGGTNERNINFNFSYAI